MPRQRHNTVCTLHTPAKLNLCLDLLGRRTDGYHEIRTVMSSVRLYDTLRVEALSAEEAEEIEEPIQFELVGQNLSNDIPAGQENLVVRALELLRAEADPELRAQVQLVKRIPSQAGLGGGSSDAGAALVAGNRVWGLGLSTERLATIGARLGSDIPFFVYANSADKDPARAALCEGRGERIRPFRQAGGIPCVIVKPAKGLGTADVYGAVCEEDLAVTHGNAARVERLLAQGRWRDLRGAMGNALQSAAMRVGPWMGLIPRLFDHLPVVAHQLTGSGSAYFAICRTVRESLRIAGILRANNLGRVFTTTTC